MVAYSLDQAQRDIASLRGQIAHLLAYAEFLRVQVDTSLTVTGTTTLTGASTVQQDQLSLPICGAQADKTQFSKTNPTGTAVDITKSWSIPANDARAGTVYVIEMDFNGVWEASGNLNFEFDLDSTQTNLTPVASGLAVAGHNYGGVIRLFLQCLTTGSGGTCNIWNDGGITDTSVARAGATSAVLFGINLAHAFDTTVSHTLAISAVFSASNASQTIIGQGSTFTRIGP